mgnify:CR=1 FL=1
MIYEGSLLSYFIIIEEFKRVWVLRHQIKWQRAFTPRPKPLSSIKKSGVWCGAAAVLPIGFPPKKKKNAGTFLPKKLKSQKLKYKI